VVGVCHLSKAVPLIRLLLAARLSLKSLDNDFDKTESDISALQSVGQVIGEMLKQIDDERCKFV
jgi:hypothetical protein